MSSVWQSVTLCTLAKLSYHYIAAKRYILQCLNKRIGSATYEHDFTTFNRYTDPSQKFHRLTFLLLRHLDMIKLCWYFITKSYFNFTFQPFTARCYAERGYATQYVFCLSVCIPVTFRYDFHTGWNTSKIISLLNSSRYLLTLTPSWAISCNGNTLKIRAEYGWG